MPRKSAPATLAAPGKQDPHDQRAEVDDDVQQPLGVVVANLSDHLEA